VSDSKHNVKRDYTSLASEDLMLLVADGDRIAFSCLVNRHQETIFRLIYRFFGKEEEANDLAQEVFVRIWRSSQKYTPTSKFTTWLYTLTANVCKSEARSLWRRNIWLIGSFWTSGDNEAPEFPAHIPSPEDAAMQAEQTRLVQVAIESLPTNQRLALVLRRYEELSYQEIADVIGCSVAAVEALLVRAKANLQKKLLLPEK
jgi:RNA polymerase sigma-70 factor (ECF subfamily)